MTSARAVFTLERVPVSTNVVNCDVLEPTRPVGVIPTRDATDIVNSVVVGVEIVTCT